MSEVTNKVVVTLKIGVDVDAFIEEMSNVGNVSPHVPNRAVEIFNLKEDSLRNVDFTMTYTEMEELRKDQRVLGCRWGTKKENGIEFGPCVVDATKTYNRNGNGNNRGIIDCVSDTNPFITDDIISNYNYNLDGTDVDVVITDSGGILIDHDEFKDSMGNSRFKKIDWWIEAGLSGASRPWTPDPDHMNMHTGFYDASPHATHVASTAVGLNVGWAKNANIYSCGAVINFSNINLIRLWHERKSINPRTGRKNPTIVNMSLAGFQTSRLSFFPNDPSVNTDLTVNFRGNQFTENVNFSNYQEKLNPYGLFIGSNGVENSGTTESLASVNSDLVDLILSGVIVVAAAGNNSQLIERYSEEPSSDYNNYLYPATATDALTGMTLYSRAYYNRGTVPGSVALSPKYYLNPTNINKNHIGVICVGASEIPPSNGMSGVTKASFSNCGPRIDVYAPGTRIYGASIDSSSSYTYMSGTSMASPQVCGVLACVLQANPYFTQEDAIKWLKQHCNTTKMTDHAGDGTRYDLTDVQGSQLRYLNMPYRSNNSGRMTSN